MHTRSGLRGRNNYWYMAWVYGASRDTWWPSMVNNLTGLGRNYMGDKNGKLGMGCVLHIWVTKEFY